MRYYLDTEFHEERDVFKLISIALVAEDGREFYAVNSGVQPEDCNDWVREHVWPHVFDPADETWLIADRDIIRDAIVEFIGDDKPEFWGSFCAYDWVLLCQLFGAAVNKPVDWPWLCHDLAQEAMRLDAGKLTDLVPAEHPEHNALADARWMRKVHKQLELMDTPERMP